MKWDLKTMLKVTAVIAGMLAIGFFAFPQFRPVIIGLAPFALFALSPQSMVFMMFSMNNGHREEKSGETAANK